MIFGLGLIVSGMTDPHKVQGFLDVAGRWDPSLAFVMVGAIAVAFVGFRFAERRAAPVFDDHFHLPRSRTIDRRLVVGSALFGVGWGLGGFCPGPAIVSLGALTHGAIPFLLAMIVGLRLVDFADARRARVASSSTPSPLRSTEPACTAPPTQPEAHVA
ncbi:MAG: DUF6691 family protein [Polyangiales bacterium]